MTLRSRTSAIEDRISSGHELLTIFVSGVDPDFVGTDPFDEKSNSSPRLSESLEAFIDRVQRDAIAAGKSHLAIFGLPRDYGKKPYLRSHNRLL
jgi:hypothetical protein